MVGDAVKELGRYLSADGERSLHAVRAGERSAWSRINVLGERADDPRLIELAVTAPPAGTFTREVASGDPGKLLITG